MSHRVRAHRSGLSFRVNERRLHGQIKGMDVLFVGLMPLIKTGCQSSSCFICRSNGKVYLWPKWSHRRACEIPSRTCQQRLSGISLLILNQSQFNHQATNSIVLTLALYPDSDPATGSGCLCHSTPRSCSRCLPQRHLYRKQRRQD